MRGKGSKQKRERDQKYKRQHGTNKNRTDNHSTKTFTHGSTPSLLELMGRRPGRTDSQQFPTARSNAEPHQSTRAGMHPSCIYYIYEKKKGDDSSSAQLLCQLLARATHADTFFLPFPSPQTSTPQIYVDTHVKLPRNRAVAPPGAPGTPESSLSAASGSAGPSGIAT